MPISTATFTPIFISNLSGIGFTGSMINQLSSGLASGLADHLRLGVSVTTIDVGSTGVGTGTGSVYLDPLVVYPAIKSSGSATFSGVSFETMCLGISYATALCVLSCIPSTIHSSVGTGTGVGTLSPNGVPTLPFYISGLRSAGLNGALIDNLAQMISLGIDSSLPTSLVNVVISGSFSPSAASGVGTGFLQ